MSKKAEAFLQFLQAASNLAKQGVKKSEILKFAKLQFGKVTDEITKAVDNIFEKSPLEKILDRRKAAKKSIEERKVLDMDGNVIDPNQPIIGGKQDKGITTLKTEFTPEQAAEDIFPSGDYKYDMDMAAESYVENNPEMFKNMLYEDLDQKTQMEVYEKVSKVISRKNAEKIKAKKANPESKPKGFQLNVEKFVQDFPVSKEEATRISKLPTEEQEKIIKTYLDEDFSQQITLMDFKPPKDRKPNATGGRAGYAEAGSVRKDPDEVVAGMDNELNPGFFDQLPFFGAGKYPLDKDQGASLIEEIQDYKYGESYPGETIGVKEKGIFNVIPKPNRPSMSMEETIKALEDRWDIAIEEGHEPGKGGEFDDLGIYSKEDIRRRVELGYDQAKGPEIKTEIMTAAAGGRAGYYGGGMTNMIEPDLSDIGHGSDALMARTRLTAPGSQATTSTGLNYLLGEDNDNIRVPFQEGLNFDKAFEKMLEKETEVEKNPNEIIKEKITEKLTPFIPNETEKEKEEKEMFKMVEEYQKFKKDNPDSRMSLFMFRDKKKKEKTLLKNKIIELDLKYPEKEIIDKETNMVNKENLKSAIDKAEANLEISPIDGLTLKKSINTEGEQSVTSGSFDLGNLNFSSDNIEEGKLTSKGNFDFGGLNLSGMVDSNDGQILKTGLDFNYDNALKGKMTNSDGYRSTELDLNKTFPINDKFNLNLKGSADTQTFNGKTYKSSDLTPKLSYNDGILNASIAKEVIEGGNEPNLGLGVNYNNFYAKGDDLLSKDRSGVIGYQKEFGDKDGDFFFTAGGEKNIFDDGYTGGVGLKYKFADGGIAGLRQGYSKGKKVGVDLARRGFLKVLGATAAGVAAFKTGALKLLGKTATTKAVPEIVKIAEGSGAPAWFEPMVNKVLADGLDITKKNATMDGQIVKSLDTPTGKVEVNYDTRSGNVDVNYMGDNTAMGEGVDMRYVVGQADEGTKGVKPLDEFEANEAIPQLDSSSGNFSGSHQIAEMGENVTTDVKGLYSDTSELAELGGQKPLIKDISTTIKKKQTLKKMNENPDEFAMENAPEYYD